jgi:hypothetical protein
MNLATTVRASIIRMLDRQGGDPSSQLATLTIA